MRGGEGRIKGQLLVQQNGIISFVKNGCFFYPLQTLLNGQLLHLQSLFEKLHNQRIKVAKSSIIRETLTDRSSEKSNMYRRPISSWNVPKDVLSHAFLQRKFTHQ